MAYIPGNCDSFAEKKCKILYDNPSQKQELIACLEKEQPTIGDYMIVMCGFLVLGYITVTIVGNILERFDKP